MAKSFMRRAPLTIPELAAKYHITDPGESAPRFAQQAAHVCRYCCHFTGTLEFTGNGRTDLSELRYQLKGMDSRQEAFLVTGLTALECLTSTARLLATRYAKAQNELPNQKAA